MVSLAIAGLGTVGADVVKLLQHNSGLIARRVGQLVTVKAVSARDKSKPRDFAMDGIDWVDDPLTLATRADVDMVVELVGGADGMAYALAKATLAVGKPLITANKALLAAHGAELAALAEAKGATVAFEAAVAGGIPVIKSLREGLAGNSINMVRGILNGTCNYILTRMREEKLSFVAALAEAQKQGYAESDPTADVEGFDTANKLALLASLAFGCVPDVAAIDIEGITGVASADLDFASKLDCRIKLLGVARMTSSGLEQRVGPALVPKSSPLAHVGGAMNAVLLRGDFVGDLMLEGHGAGGMPTASAVVADIMDVARGARLPMFGVPAAQLVKARTATSATEAGYYVRLQALDKPGVVADISAILRDEAISIASLIQHGTAVAGAVPVVITTHHAPREAMRRVMRKIAALPTIAERPCLMPIED